MARCLECVSIRATTDMAGTQHVNEAHRRRPIAILTADTLNDFGEIPRGICPGGRSANCEPGTRSKREHVPTQVDGPGKRIDRDGSGAFRPPPDAHVSQLGFLCNFAITQTCGSGVNVVICPPTTPRTAPGFHLALPDDAVLRGHYVACMTRLSCAIFKLACLRAAHGPASAWVCWAARDVELAGRGACCCAAG